MEPKVRMTKLRISAAFSFPIILLIGILIAADPWVVLQVNNEKIIKGKVLALKRDI